MSKDKERNMARILYVEQGKNAKEVAAMLEISEKTISTWVIKFNWKQAKSAKAISHSERIDNLYRIIDQLATDRIRFSSEISDLLLKKTEDETTKRITELRNEIARLDAAVANWNKTLLNVGKENQINQLVFIQVMEIVFRYFDSRFPEFMQKSMDFQEYMINDIIPKYTKD